MRRWVLAAWWVLVGFAIAGRAGAQDVVITGRVVDHQGSGVPGAVVEIGTDPGPSSATFEVRHQVTSRDGGGFELRYIGVARRLALCAQLGDRRSQTRRWIEVRPGELELAPLKLEEPPALEGIVTGPDGPVVGARVFGHALTRWSRWDGRPVETYTDAEGHYRLPWGPEVRLRLWAEAPDEGLAVCERQDVGDAWRRGGVDFQLEASTSVFGLVEDAEGKPLAGVTVAWDDQLHQISHSIDDFSWESPRQMVTEADGSFELNGLPAGRVFLRATSPLHNVHERSVEVEAGDIGLLKLVLRSRESWTGRVLDARTGEGIPEVELGSLTRTDSLGCFQLQRRHAGTVDFFRQHYFYEVRHPDHATLHLFIPRSHDGEELRIELEPRARLRGLLIDREGRPVPGVTVERTLCIEDPFEGLRFRDRPSNEWMTTDLDGRFEIELYPDERNRIAIEHPDWNLGWTELVVSAGETREQVFRAPAPARQAMRLLRPDGFPRVGHRVSVFQGEEPFLLLHRCHTDTDGSCSIPEAVGEACWILVTNGNERPEWFRLNLQPGPWPRDGGLMQAFVREAAPAELAPVSAVAGVEIVLKLPDRPGLELRGQIVDDEDVAEAGWCAVAWRCTSPGLPRQMFEGEEFAAYEDSGFEFFGLPPLPVELLIFPAYDEEDGGSYVAPRGYAVTPPSSGGRWVAPRRR